MATCYHPIVVTIKPTVRITINYVWVRRLGLGGHLVTIQVLKHSGRYAHVSRGNFPFSLRGALPKAIEFGQWHTNTPSWSREHRKFSIRIWEN